MLLKTAISTADEKAIFHEKEGWGGISTIGADKVLIMKDGMGGHLYNRVFLYFTGCLLQ